MSAGELHSRNGNPIRLMLVDDHPFVLMGLKLVFDRPGFHVVETCEDGARAIAGLLRHRPDVLILDMQMPGMNGFEVLREIAQQKLPTKVIVLTGGSESAQVAEAAKLGARGLLGKSEPPDRLLQCVREVHAGGSWLKPPTTRPPAPNGQAPKLAEILTRRESEIVELIAKALPNKTVAAHLGITEGTVKVHLHNIYEKLKVRGRMDLLLHFTQGGKASP